MPVGSWGAQAADGPRGCHVQCVRQCTQAQFALNIPHAPCCADNLSFDTTHGLHAAGDDMAMGVWTEREWVSRGRELPDYFYDTANMVF